jgi:hypothetical protein
MPPVAPTFEDLLDALIDAASQGRSWATQRCALIKRYKRNMQGAATAPPSYTRCGICQARIPTRCPACLPSANPVNPVNNVKP